MTGRSETIETTPPLRVLLVEDSLDDADLIIEELRLGGYLLEHERVESEAGLRAALRGPPWQLILCDYSLPGFDALAALKVLRESGLDVPFIVLSGAIGEDMAVEAMRAGAQDFLIKGRLARLLPAVERELREAKVRAERRAMQEQLLLSDRLVQVGTLAAGVAHEINNPLAYVVGNISLALDELRAGTSEQTPLIQALQMALEGTERIRTITADLRVFSRSDDREPQPVQLKRVLESAISMAWNQIRHRAELVRSFEPVPPIAANENRLAQVFLNLLINAAHAIPEGNAARHKIAVSLRADGNMVEVCVSDSGLGLSSEVRARLFQPFFTTKPHGEGTGLGLSICQKIVRELGGDIGVAGNPSGGTTFCVRLPIGRLAPSAPPPELSIVPSNRRGRVLVIDDEPAIVDIVQRILRSEHDTVGVQGARAALTLLAGDSAFDVIVCDLMMPDMSGVELYEELGRNTPALRERMVFMSGGAFTASTRSFLAQIENTHIQKPFDSARLRRTVREQLSRLDEHTPASAPLRTR